MPGRRITSTAEFARYVGLARTTVSRVLNGQPGLKAKTIERVERAIAETGFAPNAYALHLKGKRTATIGVCMEDLLTPPAVRKLATLQRSLRDSHFTTLIEVFEPGQLATLIRHFRSMRVDGIVFIGHFAEAELTAQVSALGSAGTPHIIIDQNGIPGANTITLDRALAMRQLVEGLWAAGHRRFGLIGLDRAPAGRHDRRPGIEAALHALGTDFASATLSLDALHPRQKDFQYGRLIATAFAAKADRPTAYLSLNDEIAIGAIHGFQQAGLSVPGNVSVAGFNNQDISEMVTPPLTTVDQEIEETIAVATRLLLEQIGQPPRTRPLLRTISPRLVWRASTGPAPR